MKVHLFNSSALAYELANDELPEGAQAMYLVGGWVISLIANYSTLIYSNASRNWFGLSEFIVVLLISIIGLRFAYKCNGGKQGKDFVLRFVCLSLPVGMNTYLGVWGLFHVSGWIFRENFSRLSFSSKETADGFLFFSEQILPYAITLLFVSLSVTVLLWRISYHLSRITTLKQNLSSGKKV